MRLFSQMGREYLERFTKAGTTTGFVVVVVEVGAIGMTSGGLCSHIDNGIGFEIVIGRNQSITEIVFKAHPMTIIYAVEVLDGGDDGLCVVVGVEHHTQGDSCPSF